MSNLSPALKAAMYMVISVLVISSCKKEVGHNKRAFKATIDTWYRFSPAAPSVLVVNGKSYVGFGHFPGGGTGNATHLGNCTNYFNQLAYTTPPNTNPEGSVSAPVIDVINYPVLGAPLPFIQAGDFSSFALVASSLMIPASVQGNIINSVLYNGKGDAIFTSALSGSGSTFPISETKVGFNGKGIILGGRGKFINAVGEFDYDGYFNLVDANDAKYNADGWIDY